MTYRPPTPEELKEGLECQIIDMIASAESLQSVEIAKKHFKRDVVPEVVYKDHILTARDVQFYALNPHLINRDILIKDGI